MKLRSDQEVIQMSEVPLESARCVIAALLQHLQLVVVRTSGMDYEEFDVMPRSEIDGQR